MPSYRKKDNGATDTVGPAMSTRSRTSHQRPKATAAPPSLPDSRRKRESANEARRNKQTNNTQKTMPSEPPTLNHKDEAQNGTWGILHSMNDSYNEILLRGEKFTIGRENCDWNIKELPENEVLCTLKMSLEQERYQYSILSHSASRLLKVNDLLLLPDEERPLVTGDVVCWSLETPSVHMFLATADRRKNDAESHLEDPTSLGSMKDAYIHVAQRYFRPQNLVLGDRSRDDKKDSSTMAIAKSTLPAALDAMEIDDAQSESIPQVLDRLKRLNKMFKTTNKLSPGTAMSEREENLVSPLCLLESIKDKIIPSEQLEHSFQNFPYYLSEKVQDRLLYTANVYFRHPSFASMVHNVETLNRRVLLTGPAGTSRCMTAMVEAVAKDTGAGLLVFDWDALNADADDENDDDLGTGDELFDDFDFFEEFERRVVTTGESLNLGFGSRKPAKRGRNKGAPSRTDHDKLLAAKKQAGSTGKTFKKGDRVMFVGNGKASSSARPSDGTTSTSMTRKGPNGVDAADGVAGPRFGSTGRVAWTSTEDPHRVAVCFDSAIPGAGSVGESNDVGRGVLCDAVDLRLEQTNPKRNGQESIFVDAFFEAAQRTAASKKNLVIHIKDAEMSVLGKPERCSKFKRRLDMLTGSVLVIGTTIREQKKDTGPSGLFSKLGSHPSAMLEFGFFEKLGKADDKLSSKAENTKSIKLLSKLFPNHVCIVPPVNDPELKRWKKAIERDTELMNEEANRRLMATAMQKCNAYCPELDRIAVCDAQLPAEDVEKLIALSVAHRLMQSEEPEMQDGKLLIDRSDIAKASNLYKSCHEEPVTVKSDLHDVQTDNEFEKRLLAEVVPPSEVGVGFNDIGALENVKKTLQEIVMLPLQRPELFARGQLLKPTKGVLLFGPPGTGKTMLAKAVAAESGANFLNMSVSSIASKWFGEGEKYVRALFSLAHKISPCVIFVDEVDSLLGRRDKTNEHEAMRKIKNEFMANWDGLRTNERDRVLVLAATNRPMDLDEAVIRRMPRRLLVDLPDAENRIKILKTILRHEEVDNEFNYEDIAAVTDGYSGSDLKNLCLEAALHPVRDFLKNESEQQNQHQSPTPIESEPVAEAPQGCDEDGMREDDKFVLSLSTKKSSNAGKHTVKKARTVQLRPIRMEDMQEAARQIASSVSNDAISMTEIRNWNQMYGEGGNRQKTPLSYFM